MEMPLKRKYSQPRIAGHKRPPKSDNSISKLTGKDRRTCPKCGKYYPLARGKHFICRGRVRVRSITHTSRCRGLGVGTGDPKARAEKKRERS